MAERDEFVRFADFQFKVLSSGNCSAVCRQWFSARVTEAGRLILLHGATRRAGEADPQIRSARRAKGRARRSSRAASATAAWQGWNITARFLCDVIFDYLPRVFGEFVLPVRAQRRQREQQSGREGQRDRGDRSFVEPLLHANLDARAAG